MKCGGKIVGKTLHSGALEIQGNVNLIYTTRLEQEHLQLDASVGMAPILFQEYVEKETEIRVTVIGRSIFAAEIDFQSSFEGKDDWRKAGPGSLKTNPVQLPKSLSDKCLQIVKELGLNFGTIDMIKTPNGSYVFLELNPNGQWGWLEEATGESYTDALVQNLDAARSV